MPLISVQPGPAIIHWDTNHVMTFQQGNTVYRIQGNRSFERTDLILKVDGQTITENDLNILSVEKKTQTSSSHGANIHLAPHTRQIESDFLYNCFTQPGQSMTPISSNPSFFKRLAFAPPIIQESLFPEILCVMHGKVFISGKEENTFPLVPEAQGPFAKDFEDKLIELDDGSYLIRNKNTDQFYQFGGDSIVFCNGHLYINNNPINKITDPLIKEYDNYFFREFALAESELNSSSYQQPSF